MAKMMTYRDILERHLPIHHAESKGVQRTLVACQTCRHRKSKCNSGDPCLTCSHLKVPCVRVPSSTQVTPTRVTRPQALAEEPHDENAVPIGLHVNTLWDTSSTCNKDSGDTPGSSRKHSTISTIADGEVSGTLRFNWPSVNEWASEVRPVSCDVDLVEALLALPATEDDNQCQPVLPQTPDSLTSMGQTCLPETVFHEAWGILHHSTLERADQYPWVSQALKLVKWPLSKNNERNKLVTDLMRHLVAGPEGLDSRLTETFRAIQALVIVLISFTAEDILSESAHWAAQGTDVAISAMRRMGMFSGQWVPLDNLEEDRWMCEEEVKRMAYAVLRLDVYFSIAIHRPPSVRFQELRLALPVTETLWRASKAEDRYRLQWFEPAGRDKCIFQSAVQEIFQSAGELPDNQRQPFEELDSHLALCAIQVDLWSAIQALRGVKDGAGTEFLMPVSQQGSLGYQRNHLSYCQSYLEGAYKRGHICCTGRSESQHFWLTLNLTLFHLTLLNIHADISLLESQRGGNSRQEIESRRAIRAWADSAHGRKAVFHAAQLQQKSECKTCASWPEYYKYWNPLRPIALLYSCIVLCAYNAECTISLVEDSAAVELSGVSGMDEAVQYWIREGGSASIRGTILGRSALSQLIPWSCERLSMFNASCRRFERFVSAATDYR
ncbi:hypothetical protein MGYG_08316 [Nannizzia gypsea CBS 118893]|uniref:Zn(2)-C6 fungal-type domain-containing protein n=1 Tax=Arthroderma gypseum (strain ATCC MYA-4604 / CBS 118893) TaxID=535722 RepID=E4V6C2_ARTGP|nr:hypothetical protein MGYG_08316 [Nannizzia gypsea CBS 118893]EFR05305.1 hypothetical protein MGYG_08316 [Nannizzia gypsea CBS 118893]